MRALFHHLGIDFLHGAALHQLLGSAHRRGRQRGELGSLGLGVGRQVVDGQDTVDQAHRQRFVGQERLAQHQLFSGALVAGDTLQQQAG